MAVRSGNWRNYYNCVSVSVIALLRWLGGTAESEESWGGPEDPSWPRIGWLRWGRGRRLHMCSRRRVLRERLAHGGQRKQMARRARPPPWSWSVSPAPGKAPFVA